MFLDCTDLIADNPARFNCGMVVLDVDGDGRFEIFVTGYGDANQVLKWDGSALIDIAKAPLNSPECHSIVAAAGDMDGDGIEEIYVVNERAPEDFGDSLFACFGDQWIDLFSHYEENYKAVNRDGRAVTALDRRGDGHYSFAVVNDGTPIRLFELGARGQVTDVAADAGVDAIVGGGAIMALPLFSPTTDIYVGNADGGNLLFRNAGDGSFEEIAIDRRVADAGHRTQLVMAFDADENEMFDLFCGNDDGPHQLFLQRAGGGFEAVSYEDMMAPSALRNMLVADFNNDGYPEIFMSVAGGPNRLFGLDQDDHEWREMDIGDADAAGLHAFGAVAADIDGDGQLEVLVSHGDKSKTGLSLYKMPPNDHHWLRVLPLTAVGAPARGAVVICHAAGRRMLRFIHTGMGWGQIEPVAHFGLGTMETVERVEIYWPDGTHKVLQNPDIDQLHKVEYPGDKTNLTKVS